MTGTAYRIKTDLISKQDYKDNTCASYLGESTLCHNNKRLRAEIKYLNNTFGRYHSSKNAFLILMFERLEVLGDS